MGSSDVHEHGAGHGAADAIRRLLGLLKQERQGLWVVFVYAVGIGIASLAAPIGVQMLVSAIAFGGLAQPIVALTVLVLVALTFEAALRAIQAWVVELIQQRLYVRVASQLADRLPRVSVASLDQGHGPELVNRFFDVLTLQKGASMLLLDGILVVLQVFVGGILLALYHPALLGFAVVLLIAILFVLFGMSGGGIETSIAESKAKYALVAWFEEIARHPTIFRGTGGSDFAEARSEGLTRAYLGYRRAHFRVVFRQTVAFLGIQAVATAALLGIGGGLVLSGQLTLGQLVAAELILTGVVSGLAKFGKYVEVYYDLIAATDKLGMLVDLPVEREARGAVSLVSGPMAIRASGVAYAYGAAGGLRALSLNVEPGARLAIVGPNGAGKSTLIDLLFGLREPSEGHIEVDGLPLRELSLPALRRDVALVRGAAMFEGTVLDNICMSRKEVTLADARRSLELVGLWEEVARMPDGLQTRITTNGGNLSAGQAQRIALARAVVTRPRCLLLDDALDDLDPESRSRALEGLLGAGAPWTAIVASHDPTVIAACSRSLALERSPAVGAAKGDLR